MAKTTPTYPATQTFEATRAKLIKNLYNKLLKEANVSLLARGLIFVVVPLQSLKGKYIDAVEKAYLKLPLMWERILGQKPLK